MTAFCSPKEVSYYQVMSFDCYFKEMPVNMVDCHVDNLVVGRAKKESLGTPPSGVGQTWIDIN